MAVITFVRVAHVEVTVSVVVAKSTKDFLEAAVGVAKATGVAFTVLVHVVVSEACAKTVALELALTGVSLEIVGTMALTETVSALLTVVATWDGETFSEAAAAESTDTAAAVAFAAEACSEASDTTEFLGAKAAKLVLDTAKKALAHVVLGAHAETTVTMSTVSGVLGTIAVAAGAHAEAVASMAAVAAICVTVAVMSDGHFDNVDGLIFGLLVLVR